MGVGTTEDTPMLISLSSMREAVIVGKRMKSITQLHLPSGVKIATVGAGEVGNEWRVTSPSEELLQEAVESLLYELSKHRHPV